MRRFLCAFAALCLVAVPLPAQEPIRTIVLGSGLSQEKPQPIWDAMLSAKPNLCLLLGSSVYLDGGNPEIWKRKYDQLAEVPGFKKMKSAAPIFATWDDHDYGAIQAGSEFPSKAAAKKQFLDFFGEAADSQRRSREGLYDARVFGPSGQRVQVILLDTRWFRSPLKRSGLAIAANTDPAATVLGAEQWAWLAEQLKTPADLRLIGSAIPVLAEAAAGGESWSQFPLERDKLLKLLKSASTGGIVLLSGHKLMGELSLVDAGLGYPLLELTASGLNMANRNWHSPRASVHRVASYPRGDHFGVVAIDWQSSPAKVELQIRDAEGEPVCRQKLTMNDLKPGAISEQPATASTQMPAAPKVAGSLTPLAAAGKVGETVTVEFKVINTGKTKDDVRAFLNSAPRDSKENFTVVIDLKKAKASLNAAGVTDPVAHYKGKTIAVTGKVSTFRDAPQIIVEDAAQIKVLD